MNTINLKDLHSYAITNILLRWVIRNAKSPFWEMSAVWHRYICVCVTKHLSPNFQNAKQVQNCAPKKCKAELRKTPKHNFNTKHISECLQMYFISLNATHITKFSTCSLNLPLTQHCLQRALDHSSFAKVHQFYQTESKLAVPNLQSCVQFTASSNTAVFGFQQ